MKVVRVGRERIDAYVQIFRGPSNPIELQYQILWSGKEMEGLPLSEYYTD